MTLVLVLSWLLSVIPGPLPALVTEVIDGDTLRVEVATWPGTTVTTLVRIKEIDAPELRGACEAERALARQAQAALADLPGTTVWLSEIQPDKFGGRVLAQVVTTAGERIAMRLLRLELARPYTGKARSGWCP